MKKRIKYDVVYEEIEKYKLTHKGNISFLDVGGRKGEFRKHTKGFEYLILEIDKDCKDRKNTLIGDICKCPNIPNESYDIIFSNDVFEHIEAPWLAADECIRICKKGGLLIHIAPFSARYHPVPVDTFRYSHYGFKCLFERYGNVKTVLTGYIKKSNEKEPDKRWKERWSTIYIGEKIK